MFKNKKLWLAMILCNSGFAIYAEQTNKLSVVNNSSMMIDVYVVNRNTSHKTEVYNSSNSLDESKSKIAENDGTIEAALSKIGTSAPNNQATIVYKQDPRAVVVRFYDPADSSKIIKIISFVLNDRAAQIIVEGNNLVGDNLTAWSVDAAANNANKPVANAVALFVNTSTVPTMFYEQQNINGVKIATRPALS